MHYDEATGDMIGDDDSYMSTPYRSEYSSNGSVWRERMSGIIKYLLLLVACWFIGRYIGECRPRDKIEEWWRSFSRNHISREEQSVNNDAASQQEATSRIDEVSGANSITTINTVRLTCCSCGTVFDISRHKDEKTFYAYCPRCYTYLRCEVLVP